VIKTLHRIGYWQERGAEHLPRPETLMDGATSGGAHSLERARVAALLRAGTSVFGSVGYSTCRVCGLQNGRDELTDGTYVWPEGLAHYVEAHGVVLPVEVTSAMTHCTAPLALDNLAGAQISMELWLALTQ
jgi:hypothetical protein